MMTVMTMMKMVWERLGEWWYYNDNNDEVGEDNDEEEKMNMTMMTRRATVDMETIRYDWPSFTRDPGNDDDDDDDADDDDDDDEDADSARC